MLSFFIPALGPDPYPASSILFSRPLAKTKIFSAEKGFSPTQKRRHLHTADSGAQSRLYSLSAAYWASVTLSHHSLEVSSPGHSTAMWLNHESGLCNSLLLFCQYGVLTTGG